MSDRNVVAYWVTVSGNEPVFTYKGVMPASAVLPPELAVQTLRQYSQTNVYVEITQHVMDEMRLYWNRPTEDPVPLVQQLRSACLSQRGAQLLWLPRTVIEELIIGLDDPYRHLEKFILDLAEPLTPTEQRILARLAPLPGAVVSTSEIMRCAGCSSAESLWVHMRRLREKLNPDMALLHTVRGVGYYLETASSSTPDIIDEPHDVLL